MQATMPVRATAWRIEAEQPSTVRFDGAEIDVAAPGGITLWYRRRLSGRIAVSFQAKAVAQGGALDAVSDVNAFWMAHEGDSGTTPRPRGGAFAEYDTLRLYYLGLGGNRNTTTRLRRYVGRAGERPLSPQHDRGDAAALLQPDRWTTIRLVAAGGVITVERDGRTLFRMNDPHPYTSGWFGLRTTASHIRYRHLRWERLP